MGREGGFYVNTADFRRLKYVDKQCATNGEQILEPCYIINFYWE